MRSIRSPLDGFRSPFGRTQGGGGFVPAFYVDGTNGDNGNDGLTLETAKLTWAAASALASPGDGIFVAGGVYSTPITIPTGVTFHGDPADRPVVDLRGLISSWTEDPTYPNVYYADVTHAYDIVPAASLAASSPHFMLWDRRSGTGEYLDAYWGGADIAANRAHVNDTPGTFTCHFQGSTAKDPRTDTVTGTTRLVRYYVRLADDADPNTVDVLHADGHQERCLILPGAGGGARNVRCIGAMWRQIGVAGGETPDFIDNVESIDCLGHGFVGSPKLVRRFKASGIPATTKLFSQAGLNLYRSTMSLGTSDGVAIVGPIEISGFGRAVYWHGNGGGVNVHAFVSGGGFAISDCDQAFVTELSDAENVFSNISVTDCTYLVQNGQGARFSGGTFTATAAMTDARGVWPTVNGQGPTIEDFEFAFSNSGQRFLWINLSGGGTKNVTMRRVTSTNGVGGNALTGIGTTYRDMDVELEECDFGDLMAGFAAVPFTSLMARDSTFGMGGRSQAYLAAIGQDVDASNTLTGVTDVTAPTITSSASPEVVDGVAFDFTLVANETVAWSIIGGADAASFTLSGAQLTLPAQTWIDGGDNTREVIVRALDFGGNTADQTITLTVTEAANPELVQAGWSTDAGWVENSAGNFTATNAAANTEVEKSGIIAPNAWYEITVQWSGVTTPGSSFRLYLLQFTTAMNIAQASDGASGTKTAVVQAPASGTVTAFRALSGSSNGTFQISIVETDPP